MGDDREADILLLQGLIKELPSSDDTFERWKAWQSCALSIIDLLVPEESYFLQKQAKEKKESADG